MTQLQRGQGRTGRERERTPGWFVSCCCVRSPSTVYFFFVTLQPHTERFFLLLLLLLLCVENGSTTRKRFGSVKPRGALKEFQQMIIHVAETKRNE